MNSRGSTSVCTWAAKRQWSVPIRSSHCSRHRCHSHRSPAMSQVSRNADTFRLPTSTPSDSQSTFQLEFNNKSEPFFHTTFNDYYGGIKSEHLVLCASTFAQVRVPRPQESAPCTGGRRSHAASHPRAAQKAALLE
eukprot:3446693-Prymnesium_polylepis.1